MIILKRLNFLLTTVFFIYISISPFQLHFYTFLTLLQVQALHYLIFQLLITIF